jgi:hypothetical protein
MISDGGSKAPVLTFAGLQADDVAIIECRQTIGPHSALSGHRYADQSHASQAKQPQCFDDRRMNLAADHHLQRRSTEQTLILDVPTRALDVHVTCRGKAREVGHGAAGYQPAATFGRQAQKILHPAERNVLDHRGSGRHHAQAAVLIPRADHPRGRYRRGNRCAVHEPEKSSACVRDLGWRTDAIKQFDA